MIKRFKPSFSWYFRSFYYLGDVDFTPFNLKVRTLSWKDKYSSPRVNMLPKLEITIFNLELIWYFGDDDSWTNWLEENYYADTSV